VLRIGIKLPQEWQKDQVDPVEAYESMTRVAQEAENLGFASVWLVTICIQILPLN
jgi:hypothetical protein